ncbi:MAG: SpoIVB peptidase [Defluviitaleaceae bacterium]|nr:SpoIVB peptidase [Defluviitaleaceae bacterium]MCL2275819.1 SpoIVB peptidase [Defluviitaleaceae bacterium]
MRRTYVLATLLVLTLVASFAAGREERVLPVFGSQQGIDITNETTVIPLGMTIGVRINTDGVMVLGTGPVHGENGITHNPSGDILLAGDLLLKMNNVPIKNKEVLEQQVRESQGNISFIVRRNDVEMTLDVTPAVAAADGARRIGAWVRDSTKGIGTLTFFDPDTQIFGALGHGIIDVDTKLLMSVKNGIIMPSTVTSVKRGVRGIPGELEGMVDTNKVLGTVTTNSTGGIFGQLDAEIINQLPTAPMPAACRSQIKTGRATVLTNAVDNTVQEFDIYIENVNRFATDETKGMVIRITDPALLAVTGGIVQGMSGSPILQDGRIIGAITHVFVQDPTKGYGIFIENMLRGVQWACIL